MIHKLKILPKYFEQVKQGKKTFELRKNDRKFKVGDELILQEFDGQYTGREIRCLMITNVFPSDHDDFEFLAKNMVRMNGFVVLSIGEMPF